MKTAFKENKKLISSVNSKVLLRGDIIYHEDNLQEIGTCAGPV